MEPLPVLAQDFALPRSTNSVCVAVAKFTIDQHDVFFTPSNPAPAKLARQSQSLRGAYDVLNDAYAEQLKRMETAGIAARDAEGDKIIYGIKGMLEGAVKMTFDPDRLAKSQLLYEAFKKYRINPEENMISEWSKVQQFCEEYLAKPALQEAAAMLGLDAPVRRLAVLADEIRRLMTERNAAAPEQGAMVAAREALYPEYRAYILLLNAFAAVNDDPTAYKPLIRALNDNINYVRKHAMTQGAGAVDVGSDGNSGETGGGSSGDSGGSGNSGTGSSGDTGGSGNSGTGSSGDSGNSGNSGTGGSGDSGNSGNSGTGGSGDSGGSGNSGGGGSTPDDGDGME